MIPSCVKFEQQLFVPERFILLCIFMQTVVLG